MTAPEIVQQVMTMHWDIMSCRCWVCVAGRENGLHPNEAFLDWRGKFEYVDVKWPAKKKASA